MKKVIGIGPPTFPDLDWHDPDQGWLRSALAARKTNSKPIGGVMEAGTAHKSRSIGDQKLEKGEHLSMKGLLEVVLHILMSDI